MMTTVSSLIIGFRWCLSIHLGYLYLSVGGRCDAFDVRIFRVLWCLVRTHRRSRCYQRVT